MRLLELQPGQLFSGPSLAHLSYLAHFEWPARRTRTRHTAGHSSHHPDLSVEFSGRPRGWHFVPWSARTPPVAQRRRQKTKWNKLEKEDMKESVPSYLLCSKLLETYFHFSCTIPSIPFIILHLCLPRACAACLVKLCVSAWDTKLILPHGPRGMSHTSQRPRCPKCPKLSQCHWGNDGAAKIAFSWGSPGPDAGTAAPNWCPDTSNHLC